MKWTRYDLETGRLLSNIMTKGDPLDRVGQGEGLIEGWYDPAAFMVVNGDLVNIEPDQPFDEAENRARLQRDQLLADSDWTQLPDVPLATKEAWATYRQALRDLPDHVNWPNLSEEDWPTVEG